jgi:UDP-GlcNAc:undecaprenyl-phosphate GlcNAc-1-phosphate transferase
MILDNSTLYLYTFACSLFLSLILVPAMRGIAVAFDIFDRPVTAVKTHKQPVPYLGGVAILIAFTISLFWIRLHTDFPTGTLRSLRGVLCGAAILSFLGLIDDIKLRGLHYVTKFVIQIAAALVAVSFDIRIQFVEPVWFANVLTVLWIVGLTNAFNLIDIMDGLASGVAAVAAAAFLFISLPTEAIYVNFAATALCGAALGFFPYNVSKKLRIFMGDSGSLMLGFVCGTLAIGTDYGGSTKLAVLAPIMILAVPIYDTTLVSILRLKRGMSPFVGSKDHFPLRLEALGWPRPRILAFALALALLLSIGALLATMSGTPGAVGIYALSAVLFYTFTRYILKVQVK